MELEDRVLFSAVPMAMAIAPGHHASMVGGNAGSGQVHPLGPQTGHGAWPSSITAGAGVQPVSHELVFVDTSLPDYQNLVANVTSLNNPQRQINVVLLNDNDGIQQISKTLSRYHNLDAVYILSHGTDDSVDLGGTWLQASNLNACAGQIAGWRNALSDNGSLLFYGCDLAAGAAGRTLLQDIHALTGDGVAANTGATGNPGQGGDWTLDYELGNVNPALPFNPATMAAWDGLMQTYTVTNTNDSGAGSLRNAIQLANSHPGLNTITFAIGGGGPATINLLSALPVISNSAIIDGTSQSGYAGAPLIVLNGAAAGVGTNALTISAGGSTVKGLDIENFSGFGIDLPNGGNNTIEGDYIGTDISGSIAEPNSSGGIYIDNSANNTVGGTAASLRNVISGNAGDGIDVFGPSSTNNTILGNYIGTNAAGTAALANSGCGIYVFAGATSTVIGGVAANAGNVVSGNSQYGIYNSGNTTTGTTIHGNFIGTNVSGSAAISNGGWGVYIDDGAANTAVGGTATGAGNVISGNVNALPGAGCGGIYVAGTETWIQGNTIGLNAAQTAALGNGSTAASYSAGIYVDNGAASTLIGGTAAGAGNTIANNIGPGVAVIGSSDVATIETNSICGNSALGIDLGDDGVTPDHAGGPVSGPNGLINYPVLTSVTAGGIGQIAVAGYLNSAANTTYRLELFASTLCRSERLWPRPAVPGHLQRDDRRVRPCLGRGHSVMYGCRRRICHHNCDGFQR